MMDIHDEGGSFEAVNPCFSEQGVVKDSDGSASSKISSNDRELLAPHEVNIEPLYSPNYLISNLNGGIEEKKGGKEMNSFIPPKSQWEYDFSRVGLVRVKFGDEQIRRKIDEEMSRISRRLYLNKIKFLFDNIFS